MNIPSLLQITTSLAILSLLSSCHSESGDNSAENPLSMCEVIATREIIHGDTVINCHIGKADRDRTMMIPLSMLIDSLEIVRLDPTDDALVGGYGICDFSDNYIVVSQFGEASKLFRRDGKYVKQLGAIGQGPGEYHANPDGVQIDETHNRIIFFPANNSYIMEYDLQGNYVRSIPLAFTRTGGHILADYDNGKILVVQRCFSNKSFVSGPPVWIQDFEGNAIWHTYEPIKEMIAGFSNIPFLHNRHQDGMELSFARYEPIPDSIFYFDMRNMRVAPRFTATFDGETPRHLYYKAGDYYLIGPMVYSDGKPNPWEDDPTRMVIVDTKTLRGGYCKIYNDLLGGMELDVQLYLMRSMESFNMLMDPGDLLERIDARLAMDDVPASDIEILTHLRESISEDDNSYILHGNYKNLTR